MDTVLIFGGTGGIGESCARSFHKLGKKVIITGRREARLAELAKELAGVETYAMDNGDLAALPGHAKTLLSKYPAIDTVWVNSGVQYMGNFKSIEGFTDEKIIQELNVNLAAPILLARYFLPHLLALQREGNFLITSSGLAFVPATVVPVYSATKAAVHSFLVTLRDSVKGTNVNVIEIAPPYVRTELDAANRMDKLVTPMELDEYTLKVFEVLEKPAKEIKEAAVGFAAIGAGAWRGAFVPMLEKLHSQG